MRIRKASGSSGRENAEEEKDARKDEGKGKASEDTATYRRVPLVDQRTWAEAGAGATHGGVTRLKGCGCYPT